MIIQTRVAIPANQQPAAGEAYSVTGQLIQDADEPRDEVRGL